MLLLVFNIMVVNAENINIGTLGPLRILYPKDTDIQILSPQNNDTLNNPVQLHFCVYPQIQAYADFGDIGYCINDGEVYKVLDFYRKTSVQQGDSILGEFWANITLPALDEGSYIISIYYGYQSQKHLTYDIFGYSTVEFTVKNRDVTPPNIIVESPTHNTTYPSEVQLAFTLNETATWAGYSIDGNENTTICGNDFNVTLLDLTEGTHNITVYAEDKEGNIGASKTITFNIAAPKPEPFPTLTIATVTITALTVVCLLIYYKKHKHKNTTDKKH